MQDQIDKFLTCKDCPDRCIIPNCHSYCEGYKARCEKREAIRIARKKFIDKEMRYHRKIR